MMNETTDRTVAVSIVMPVYNAERYLKESMDSLLAQTMQEFEIICVDDGSTDSSIEILEAYAQKDSRIQILRQKNQTAGAARNYGMSVAKGEYLLFLDADDIFSEKLVETAYHLAKNADADVAIWGADNYYQSTGKYEKAPWYVKEDYIPVVQPFAASDIPRDILRITTPAPWNKLFKRSYIEKHQLRYQAITHTNDAYFTSMALMLAERITYTMEALVTYRRGINDSTQGKRERSPKAFYTALSGMREELLKKGIYEMYREAYLEFARSICEYSFKAISLKSLNNAERNEIEVSLGLKTEMNRDDTEIKISIAVAVYNTEKYLHTCMDSLVNQTWKNLEIICVNDCSTDNSLKILQDYAKCDPRIVIIDKPKNEKLMRARMSAVEAATGDYLIFVDSDDYIELDTCECVVKEIKKNKADIIHYYIDAEIVSGDKTRAEWYKKAFAPYEGVLSYADILRHYYITRRVTTALVGKAYKMDLIRRAYADIPNVPVYVGEDIFASFFIAMHAKNYAGIGGKGLYHYRYGLGVSNTNLMSLEKFAMYNDMSILVQEIKHYIEARKYTRVHAEALSAMAKRMLEDVLRIFEQNRLAPEDISEAEGMLAKQWWMIPCSGELIERKLGKTVSQIMNLHDPAQVYQKLSRDRLRGKNDPVVSVIIPVFNDSVYVNDCIMSVVRQNCDQTEIICVNDGSYDDSLSVIEKYYERFDNVTIISQLNAGLSAARNAGMKLACGKYLMFLDSDDMHSNDCIDVLLDCAEKNKLDVLAFDADSFFENESVKNSHSVYVEYYHRNGKYDSVCKGIDMMQAMLKNREYRQSPCLMLLNREWLMLHNIWFEEGILHEDNLFTFCCYLNAERFSHIAKRGYLRRVHDASIMTGIKTINHARGYFACYLGMATEARRHGVDAAQYPEIESMILQMRKNAQSIYYQLAKEKRFVPRTTFDMLMKNEFENIDAQKEIKNLKKKLNEISNSRVYRMGRKLLWLPKKVRGAVRCLKKHGMKYTMNRFFGKIRTRFKLSMKKNG